MDITSTTREGIVFLATKGDLDMYAAPEFKERYSALASRDRRAHFILDLAETHYVDSSGIGAIFQVFSDVRDRGARFCLCNARGMVKELLRLSRMSSILPIETDLAGAENRIRGQA